MKLFKIVLTLLLFPVLAYTQDLPTPSLNIGDPAPQLRVREWLKGTPIQKFRKGNVYVVELWATWCTPCRAAMPRLSALAREYKDRITFIGVDVMETKKTSMEKIRRFVDSMGQRMDYNVAAEDSNFMAAGWLKASEADGIPFSFVVDKKGRLAWLGHPEGLKRVLPRVMNKTWNTSDMKEVSAKRKSDNHLRELDFSMNDYLNSFWEKPELRLVAISKIVKNEPRLKYTPLIVVNTLNSLLKTNKLQEAYEYSKAVMVTPTYEAPACNEIIDAIARYADMLNLPVEFYRLGAEAHQAILDRASYPELLNVQKRYNQMAEWYWRANDKLKALNAMQKGLEALKNKEGLLQTELALFAYQLRGYESR